MTHALRRMAAIGSVVLFAICAGCGDDDDEPSRSRQADAAPAREADAAAVRATLQEFGRATTAAERCALLASGLKRALFGGDAGCSDQRRFEDAMGALEREELTAERVRVVGDEAVASVAEEGSRLWYFRKEGGEWKVDSIGERRPGAPPLTLDAGDRADLPSVFTGRFLQIREGTQRKPEELGAALESDAGTRATITFDVDGAPPPATTAGRCGDRRYDEVSVGRGAMTGEIRISGMGRAELEATRTLSAFQGPPPPVCDERSGTWTGSSGSLEGRRGTFRFVGTHRANVKRSRLTLAEE